MNNIIADLHIHSIHSSDAESTMSENCLSAINKGLKIIGFTDHIDIDYPGDVVFSKIDRDKYLSDIASVVTEFNGKLEILTGLEIGLQPHLKESTSKFIEEFNVDYIIGSTHCVSGEEISRDGLFKNRTMIESYDRYFEAMIENIKTIDFDILGHLDFVERYYPSDDRVIKYANHSDLVDEILTLVIRYGKSLEINTSGYRYKLNKPHPSFDILRRYKELGGEFISFGSDSHRAADIAADFDKVREMVCFLGYKYYFYYSGRKPKALVL